MNRKAAVENCDYHLLETVPSLTGQEQFVLCEDGDGNKFVCPEELWLSHAPQPEALAPVHAGSTSQEKMDFFLSLFRGRDNLYAKRYYNLKTGKSGYVPACQNEWIPGICDKKAYRCPECPNRAFRPLTVQTVRAHLMGKDECCRDVVGIYPMLENDRTWLLAVDFDESTWQENVSAFRKICISCGVVPAVERSRSGNGAHVWFFFSEPVAAADARRFGSGLLTQAMAHRHELRFQSYDRLLPSQDTVPRGSFGNLIALPFQKKRSKKIFDEKTERFQDLRGPWITKIQGPQNLDFSPPPIHSGRT